MGVLAEDGVAQAGVSNCDWCFFILFVNPSLLAKMLVQGACFVELRWYAVNILKGLRTLGSHEILVTIENVNVFFKFLFKI